MRTPEKYENEEGLPHPNVYWIATMILLLLGYIIENGTWFADFFR